jgi:methionyl-tRNA synthetase
MSNEQGSISGTPVTPFMEEGKNNTISIDEFNKVDLRIAKILVAEQVEGADKLLKLQVDVGEEKPRQLFAGIRSAYHPEELIGRHVVVVANLAPRKMRFGVSEGMLIVAKNHHGEERDLWLISPDPGAEPGAQVK